MASKKLYSVLKWILYTTQIIILYVIQQNYILIPEIFRGRPIILIPALISISVFENKYSSAAFGAFTGVLLDIGISGAVGIHMIAMCAVGYLCSWCTSRFIKVNIIVYTLLCILGVFTIGIIRFLFFYVANQYGSYMYTFINAYLASMAYTLIISPSLYLFNRALAFFTGGRESA